MTRTTRMLHEDASRWTLAVARVWVFAMCLGDVWREPTQQLAAVALEYLTPVAPLKLLPAAWLASVYSPGFLAALKIALVVLLAACVLGVRPFRPIAILACTGLTLHHAIVRGVGHINHGELAMLYAAYVFAVFPSADAFSLAARRAAPPERPHALYAAAMVLVTFVFLLSYTFVGAYRVTHGGPAMFVDGSGMRLILHAAARPGIFASQSAALDLLATPGGRALVAFGFPLTTAMELLSPLALFSPAFRWLWVAIMVAFHLIAWQLMQVFFFHNLVLMPLVLTDVEWWRTRLGARRLLPARGASASDMRRSGGRDGG